MCSQRPEQKQNQSHPQRRLPQPRLSHQPVSESVVLCESAPACRRVFFTRPLLCLQGSQRELPDFHRHRGTERAQPAEAVGQPADEKCAACEEPAKTQVGRLLCDLPSAGVICTAVERRQGEAQLWVV